MTVRLGSSRADAKHRTNIDTALPMKFRIPFLSNRSQAQPLRDIIDFVANETGLDDYRVSRVMSFFLEGVADELSMGKTVRLPGFGVFAPYLDDRPQYRSRRPGPVCTPKFSAAKGFRAQVMTSAPANQAGKRDLENHRRSHSVSEENYSARRVFQSMAYFRRDIARQLGDDTEDGWASHLDDVIRSREHGTKRKP